MSDTKISALASGDPAQSTDQVPVVRAGANLRISASTLGAFAAVTSVAGRTGAVVLTEADIASLTADLAATEKTTNKGTANGYASLDSTGRVPVAQAPLTTVDAQGSGVSAYTPVLADANEVVTMSSASASTFTVPPNSSVAYPVGTTLSVIQLGAGQVSLTAGAGVTIATPSSLAARARYSTVCVIQVAANVWVAGGDLQ